MYYRHRRPIGVLYDYGLLAFSIDLVTVASKVPGTLKIGGNTGTVNSFTGVDLGNLTGNYSILLLYSAIHHYPELVLQATNDFRD